MKVIALKRGFYGRLIEPGEEFEVPHGTRGSWFAPAETKAPPKASKRPEASAEGPVSDLV